MTADLVEVLARAIYDEAEKPKNSDGGHVSDYGFHGGQTCLDGNWDLNDFVRAGLAALEAEGYRVVPVEPTQQMVDQSWVYAVEVDMIPLTATRRVWASMLAAAPKVTP